MPKVSDAQKNNTPSDESVLKVGHRYWIKRKNNVWSKGEVLLQRMNRGRKLTEYYVHFDYLDKRLDEWVPSNRFRLPSLDTNSEINSYRSFDINNQSSEAILKDVSVESCDDDMLSVNSLSDSTDATELEHEKLTRIKYINTIQLGMYEIDTWYYSPYPNEYGELEKLYICEFCLKYMRLEETYCYHLSTCGWEGPPGSVIYKKGALVIYEIDPYFHKLYCQNLSLLAKLFIDHKTIFYDVEQFLFYVLCEVDSSGSHLRGYFCKEKESHDGNNVSCILTLPPFQRQGFGKLLIGFSYELSKLEGVPGSPEKPLSDLGRLSYESFWAWILLDKLNQMQGKATIASLSRMTGITTSDIITTLLSLNLLKFWADSDTVCVPPDLIQSYICSGLIKRPRLTVNQSDLLYIPLFGNRKRCDRIPSGRKTL